VTEEKESETMKTSRELVIAADKIRQEQGLTSTGWGIMAGYDDSGMMVSRMYKRGNCKLSTMVQLLAPLGYELQIKKVEDLP
jgi:hypothetical protein